MTLEEKLKEKLNENAFFIDTGIACDEIMDEDEIDILFNYANYIALSICKQEIEDAKPKWISVKDRLPELYRLNMSKDVLIFAGSKHLVGVYDYELNRWSTSAYITVTHWMPLPEVPEVKE